jgi:hypothetical protein
MHTRAGFVGTDQGSIARPACCSVGTDAVGGLLRMRGDVGAFLVPAVRASCAQVAKRPTSQTDERGRNPLQRGATEKLQAIDPVMRLTDT